LSGGSLTQVKREQEKRPGAFLMEDAAYLRSRAELCLQMVLHISDPKAAEGLRVTAAQYLARAMDAENGSGPVGSLSPPPSGSGSMHRYYFKLQRRHGH
jgi:hypothetical protein